MSKPTRTPTGHQDIMKQNAAKTALKYIHPGMMVGVGTGSTANYFIDYLAEIKRDVKATVASSDASAERLESHGIRVLDLNQAGTLDVYVDGADEVDAYLNMIKGGGGALTREKIVAAASSQFVCIADATKQVDILGKFPLPIEVIPMARSFVARKLVGMGGKPELRTGFTTDNGNLILDIHGLEVMQPLKMEQEINQIPGVVCAGIFAQQSADVLLVGTESGCDVVKPKK